MANDSQDNSGTVIEEEDVTDLSHEETEERVDEMLDTSDLEEKEEPEDAELQQVMEEAEDREQNDTQVRVSSDGGDDSAEDDDFESFDFENQEWTLGDEKEPEIITFKGMKFKLNEPDDDDEILNRLEASADAGRDDQMKTLVQIVVEAPEIDEARWEDMTWAEKLGLSGECADYLDLTGFLNE